MGSRVKLRWPVNTIEYKPKGSKRSITVTQKNGRFTAKYLGDEVTRDTYTEITAVLDQWYAERQEELAQEKAEKKTEQAALSASPVPAEPVTAMVLRREGSSYRKWAFHEVIVRGRAGNSPYENPKVLVTYVASGTKDRVDVKELFRPMTAQEQADFLELQSRQWLAKDYMESQQQSPDLSLFNSAIPATYDFDTDELVVRIGEKEFRDSNSYRLTRTIEEYYVDEAYPFGADCETHKILTAAELKGYENYWRISRFTDFTRAKEYIRSVKVYDELLDELEAMEKTLKFDMSQLD